MQRTSPSPSCRSALSPTRKRCIDGLEMRRISPGPVRWKNQSVLRDMLLLVTRTCFTLPKTPSACSGSDSLLDQFAQERAMTTLVIDARVRAEQGDRLTCAHPRRKLLDAGTLRLDLAEVAG